MALRFIDSFDDRNTSYISKKWNTCPGAIVTGGRNGTNAYDPSNVAKKTLDVQTTWIVGFAGYLTNEEQVASLLQIQSADGGTHVSFTFTGSNRTIRANSGGGGILGTSTATVPLNTWVYFEFKVYTHDTEGTVEVRLDETPILTLTAQDTLNNEIDGASMIVMPELVDFKMDDVYICDGSGSLNNDFLGDCYITCIFPDGNGAKREWKSSVDDGTSTWENVDTNPPADTPYNYDTGAALPVTDIWTFQDITAGDSIYGVQVNCLAEAEDDEDTVTMHNICQSGGTEHDSAAYNLTEAYKYHSSIWQQDPKTSTNWDRASVNAASFGYEREVLP